MWGQASMLSVSLFESTEEAFGGVGIGWNTRMIQIVEHVGLCVDEHAAGTLDVADDPTPLPGVCNAMTMTFFPSPPVHEEAIAFADGTNTQDPTEQLTQFSSFGILGFGAAPTPTLPVNVHQAPLNDHGGPCRTEHLVQLRIAIDGGTEGVQSSALQVVTNGDHGGFAFLHPVDPRHDLVGLGIDEDHGSNPASIQKRPVDDHMAMPRQVASLDGWVVQPIPNQASQLPFTQSALLAQLSNGIALDHPTPEPHKPACESCTETTAHKRSTATTAPEQLTTGRRVAITFDPIRTTPNAQRFCAILLSS